ncbi:MAG: amidohydrolase family protein [Thermodesulfobacteriaceae bacterium]|nr:amidohydrolase family protein [Thermodesulfobacteriaceae bacterium]
MIEEIRLQPYHHYLIKAKWILPIVSPPLLEGGIEIGGGKILRVGPFKELQKEFPKFKVLNFENLIIMPCLVNVHTHLELSALRFKILSVGSFVLWVRNVIKKKETLSLPEMREYARRAIDELWKDGVGVVGDVGNTGLTLDLLNNSNFYGYFFNEIINFKGDSSLKDFKDWQISSPRFKITYSAHSPYTVAPLLIQALKSFNKKRKKIFSIHCAESKEEVEFLQTGKGPISALLKERGQWNESFVCPKLSPVKYLHSLGVLDENTLLIHAVYVDREDLEIIRETKAKVGFCPRSNLFTGVGLPKVPEFLKAGIEVALGTDSLASNDKLSIWEEIKTLYLFFPQISPETFLKMATFWGAKALGFNYLGAIKEEYLVNLIGLKFSEDLPEDIKNLGEFIINKEKKVRLRIYA